MPSLGPIDPVQRDDLELLCSPSIDRTGRLAELTHRPSPGFSSGAASSQQRFKLRNVSAAPQPGGVGPGVCGHTS